jgi:hypothetical protein
MPWAGPGVRTLAEVVMSDLAVGVDEVEGGPVVIAERLPDGVVVVDDHRVADIHLLQRPAHVVDVAFELELGRLHPDHRKSLARILVRPRPHVRKRADPVDALGSPTETRR